MGMTAGGGAERLTDADFMTIGDTALGLERPVHDVTADIEQGGLLVLGLQKVVKGIVGAVGAVVKAVAHGAGLGDASDVRV